MGRQIQKKEIDGQIKYRIWSTVVDDWLTEFMTKEEMVKYFFWDEFENFMKSFMERSIDFPKMMVDYDSKKIIPFKEDDVMWAEMMHKIYKADDYMSELAKIFKSKINELGIEMEIKDSDGYSFK